ncbi:MAG: hypothetical protein ACRDA8_12990 [Shewanella sp.]
MRKKREQMLPFLRLVKVAGKRVVNNMVSAGTIPMSGYRIAGMRWILLAQWPY